jgi:O-antigen/teichoic acid export membrane protein
MDKIKKFLLKNTSTRQTVLKNTFWIGASTTLVKIFRASIIIYSARLLGTEQYGVFTYAMSLAAIFAVFSDMGLSSILVRELSKNTEKMREYFSTALIVKVGFLSAMILLIIGVAPFLSRFDSSTALMPVIALSIVFESLRSFFYAIPRAESKMQLEAGISIINEIFCIVLIMVVFLKNPTPSSLAYSLMIGNGIGCVVALFSIRKYLHHAQKYFVRALVIPLIKLTIPFAILSVFGIFMTNIDSVIIGMLENEHMLGLYGAAQRPISILYIIPSFLSTSLLPLVSRFIKEEKTHTIHTITSIASIASIALALPLVAGGIVVAGPLISVIFGSEYSGAVLTFQILLLTLLFIFPGTIFAEILLAENKQRIFIFTGIIGALLNVGFNFLLIPSYGIIGSAIATVIALAIVNIFFYIEVQKTNKINIFRGLYKNIFATMLMTIFTYFLITLKWSLLVILPLSALLYLGLLFIMKDTTLSEIRRSVN